MTRFHDTARAGRPAGPRRPNLVFVFADQLRAQAVGYAGDPNMKGQTPHLDKLAGESVNFTGAVSCCPVCTPYRASLLTGQYPLKHGLFLNDLPLKANGATIAEAFAAAGYSTGYVGKWHLDGHGRSSYIPPERRHGFEYWKVLECTHNYNRSAYYAGNDPTKLTWTGYDVIAQTRDAKQYIAEHAGAAKPFVLFLSWGTPHNPYETAPKKYRDRFDPARITLRPNVPANHTARARRNLAGYYAHIAAMDDCIGDLLGAIAKAGVADDTIFVFTSDHGDMLGSQGEQRKQRPWDESIRVPLLVRYPKVQAGKSKSLDTPINAPDLMPTLLALAGVTVPKGVQGTDYSGLITGKSTRDTEAALIMCPSPFGEWRRRQGREYRGVRTRTHTYVRDLDGPWLLHDNARDPYQRKNLADVPAHAELQARMEALLAELLAATGDKFLPGTEYIAKWKYKVNEFGTVAYDH